MTQTLRAEMVLDALRATVTVRLLEPRGSTAGIVTLFLIRVRIIRDMLLNLINATSIL